MDEAPNRSDAAAARADRSATGVLRGMRPEASRLLLAIAALVVTLSVALAFVLTQPWMNPPTPEIGLSIGQVAPDFSITDVNGTPWILSDHRGHVVLIDFMGSNCSACIREMKEGTLQAVYAAHRSKGLVMISIDIGGPLGTEDADDAWRFIRGMSEYGTWEPGDWTVALDTGGLAGTYLVTGIPVKYLIDRTGRIAMKWPGIVAFPYLNGAIEAALG